MSTKRDFGGGGRGGRLSPSLLQSCPSAGHSLCGSSPEEPRSYLAQAESCALPICSVAKDHIRDTLPLPSSF